MDLLARRLADVPHFAEYDFVSVRLMLTSHLDLTTNEKYNWKRYPYLLDENRNFRNPYDKGTERASIRYVFSDTLVGVRSNWREFYRAQVPPIEFRTAAHQQV